METFNVALYGPTAQWFQHVGKVCGPVKTILQTNLAGIKRLFIFYVVQFSIIVNIAFIQNIQMWNALNGVWWRQTSSEYGYLTDITLVSNCLYGRVYWAPYQILYQSFHGPPRNPANGRVVSQSHWHPVGTQRHVLCLFIGGDLYLFDMSDADKHQ